MAVSQNGWPVNPPRTSRPVPGTDVRITVADGPVGDALIELAARFHRRVEPISTGRGVLDDWGYADRNVRGGTSVSNHASGTAIDLNATRHPLGSVNTFTPEQRAALRALLKEFGGLIRWGGDYAGRKDEMHFEIDDDTTYAEVAALAKRLKQQEDELSASVEQNIIGFLFTGGPTTREGTPHPSSVMGRLANLEGFMFKGGDSTPSLSGVDPTSLFARVNRLERMVEAIADKLGVPVD